MAQFVGRLSLSYVAFLLIPLISAQQDPTEMCRAQSASKSCGICIKTHPECAWCKDPSFKGLSRCGTLSSLERSCRHDQVYQPKSEIKTDEDYPVGTQSADKPGTVLIQPQRVRISMKPGETVHFPLKHLQTGRQTKEVRVTNSHVSSRGLSIDYSSNCRHGVTPGNVCERVPPSAIVEFNVSVTLHACKNSGDILVSVGIKGARDVLALFITPICSCECEKLEEQISRSEHCGGVGKLTCGACMCDRGFSGPKCGCDIRKFGASSAEEVDSKCWNPSSRKGLLCSGKGMCNCGTCQCENYRSGKFCECDDLSCPTTNGKMCNGEGRCRCGRCECEQKWTGRACECPLTTSMCLAANGKVCNDHGKCSCGVCQCEKMFAGLYCEDKKVIEYEDKELEVYKPEEGEGKDTRQNDESSSKPDPPTSASVPLRYQCVLLASSISSILFLTISSRRIADI